MASYTDTISKFNPYIAQQPVDAMVQVGMYKQQKYDEGVQKIQGYIDNIAGIDVIKDEHKNYLQSKLNELGSNLKKVAASDFSNNQLVNSVGGMATQIIKDPSIQNAVYSTQKVRQGQSDMEAARKAGKSGPSNEWDFNSQLNSWLNDKDIHTRFGGSFVEYTDYNKKLRDIADKVHEIDNTVEIPYQRDAAGNVKVDTKGRPMIDDAMLKITTKGKPAEKILNMFHDSLDENDKRQLSIDGRYNYRGATADTFKRDIDTTYQDTKKIYTDKQVDLAVQLQNPKLSDKDKASLKAQLTDVNNTLDSGSLERKRDAQIAQIADAGSIENFKAQLFTQKHLTNLAKDLSYQSHQQELVSNPYAQMLVEKQRLQEQINQNAITNSHWQISHDWEIKKWTMEQMEKQQAKFGSAPIIEKGAVRTDLPIPTISQIQSEISHTDDLLKQVDGKYINQLFNDTKMTKEAKIEAMKKAADEYAKNPSSINTVTNNAMRDYLQERRALEILKLQKGSLINSVMQETAHYDTDINKVLKDVKGVTNKFGQSLYDAGELFNVHSVAQSAYKTTKATGGIDQTTFDATKVLNTFKGTRLEPIAIAYVKRYQGQPLTDTERVLVDKAREIGFKYSPVANQLVQDKLSAQSKLITERSPVAQTVFGRLNPEENKIDAAHIKDAIGNAVSMYNELGSLGGASKRDFSPSVIGAWMEKPEIKANLDYIVHKNYDGTGSLVIQNKKENKTQTIPLNQQQFSNYFPAYAQKNSMNSIKEAIMMSGNKTSNLTGAIDPVNAFLTGDAIPSLSGTALAPNVRMDVEGSSSNDGGDNDKFQLRLYVFDNGVWRNDVVNQKGYTNEAGIQQLISNIGTRTIDAILQKSKNK